MEYVVWNPHESISVKLVTTCWFGGHGREAIEALKRFLINELVGGKVWSFKIELFSSNFWSKGWGT